MAGDPPEAHPLVLAEMLHDWALRREEGAGIVDQLAAASARRLASQSLALHGRKSEAIRTGQFDDWEFEWWKINRRAVRLLSMGTQHQATSLADVEPSSPGIDMIRPGDSPNER